MNMLHHLSFAVTDLARSAAFYDAVLGTLGYVRVWEDATFIGYGTRQGEDKFAIKLRPANEAVPGDGFHLAFAAPSRDTVTQFYQAALAHGGTDNGGSGMHPEYGPDYFAAFVTDPDGYRIEAVIVGAADGTPVPAMNTTSTTPIGPEEIVQQQLDAYNAHNLNALMATYADDVRIFEHPTTLLASGSAQLRERFAPRLQEPDLHAHLSNRIVMGRFVVDHERVARTFPDGTGTVELIATYEVVNGRISNAWFLTGPKTLDAS